MGRDNQPLYVQPRSPSTQPLLNEQLQRQRGNFGPFTRLLLSVLLQSGQAHYQTKDNTSTIIPHLLMPTPSTNLQTVKEEESRPELTSSHALDVDATNPRGDSCSDPYRDSGFFTSPQSSPPPLSDSPHKRHLLNIFQVDIISTRLQGCLKQSVSIFRVPSDTLSQAFANGKPPTRKPEGRVEAGSKDEGHDDVNDTFVGVVGTYSQQSSPEQVRFRLFKWSHRRSKEGMEAHERLPTVVDVPYTHRKHMYYNASQVKQKAEKEKKKKREARKKRREEKNRNDRNAVTPANNPPEPQSTDTQQSARPSQALPPSESQTIGIASHIDAAAPVTHLDETTPRAGCWTCFRLFICTRV